jgi:two-component system NtrC family sensor kinase
MRGKINRGESVRAKILNYQKDHRPIWVTLEIQPVRDASGSISHFVAVMEDVTEAEKLEAERRLSQKLQSVGQLASGIAHEINTPIQFVGDSITFLDEAWQSIEPHIKSVRFSPRSNEVSGDGIDAEEAELRNEDVDYLLDNFPIAIARARDGVKRVAGIVRAMKEFAHPDRTQAAKSDLNAAINNTVIVASNEYKYVGTLTVECGDIPMVPCHISSINQVLLNLIVNAAHALADKGHKKLTGKIDIRSRSEGDWVVVSVSDNGCGIPDAIRERIFDPFFTSKEIGRGTGQGLSIARAIVVEQHAGRLLVHSKVGEGSTFEVWLPRSGAPDCQVAASAKTAGDRA